MIHLGVAANIKATFAPEAGSARKTFAGEAIEFVIRGHACLARRFASPRNDEWRE